jgi:N-acetylmuramoyl-L-alanine amidase CwlA
MFTHKVKSILLKKGTLGRPGTKRTSPLGRVGIHNTGNSNKGADAKANATYLKNNSNKTPTSWHETVDEHGAYTSIPYGEKAYSFGDGGNGTGNAGVYSIEICENSGGDLLSATDNAAYRAAKFLHYYKVKEAKSGINIFQHHDFSGKDCPHLLRDDKPYSWSKFVEKVNLYLDARWGKKATTVPKKPDGRTDTKLVNAQKWAAQRKTIRKYSKNKSEIKIAQKYLRRLGFKSKNGNTLKVDGYWEGETDYAFAKFQSKSNLVEDGICGIKSWTQLKYRTL